MLPKFVSLKFKPPIQICEEFYEPLVKFILENQNKSKRIIFREVK